MLVCLTLQMWFQLWPATINKLAKLMSKLALDISTLLSIMYVPTSKCWIRIYRLRLSDVVFDTEF